MQAKRTYAIGSLAGFCLSILSAGCGYSAGQPPVSATDAAAAPKPGQVGNYAMGTIHPTNVRTVCVEIFKSQEFRRELEFRLTEALVKRILIDTPYRIAAKDRADTVLYGEVVSVPVTNLGNDFDSDLPREVQPVFIVNWTWKNQRTGEIITQRRGMRQASDYVPLGKETFFDGSEQSINDLAERIVGAMQADW